MVISPDIHNVWWLLQQRITCETDNATYAKIALATLDIAWLRLTSNAAATTRIVTVASRVKKRGIWHENRVPARALFVLWTNRPFPPMTSLLHGASSLAVFATVQRCSTTMPR